MTNSPRSILIENTRAMRLALLRAKASTYLALFKPGVVLLLLWNAVVAAFLAARGVPTLNQLLLLTLVGLLSAGGAAALNHYLDRDIDARMKRTCTRPIPSGRIAYPPQVLRIGLVNIMLSVPVALYLNGAVLIWSVLGWFTYIVVYTLWLKRRHWLNIVIGGAAGSFAVLTGWAAVRPELSWTPLVLAVLLFLWTPAHFWAFAIVRADEYRAAGVPMLPTVIGTARTAPWVLAHSVALALLAGLLYFVAPLHWVYLIGALVGSALLLRASIKLVRAPISKVAWQCYKASNWFLTLLFLAILVDVLMWH